MVKSATDLRRLLGVDGESLYSYPGYQPLPGALGEYNGKLCRQVLLRLLVRHTKIISCATYRKLFSTCTPLQFSAFAWQDTPNRKREYEPLPP